ncbi:MAG: hypothetical protein IKZ10_08395 [Akkermansia sp.]|nr:hypothetical protein [Akkermansia sp.]
MVNSLHNQIRYFCDYFSPYQESYVLIGGAACATWYKDYTPGFRATRDLDIVLILEQLHSDFVEAFLQFIHQAGYKQWEKFNPDGETKKVMYRFISPSDMKAPEQLELLSRKGNIPTLDEACTVAPVKTEDEYTGLSCIILDDNYYHFLTEHVNRVDNLSLLSIPALILLKIRAFLNLKEQYASGAIKGSDKSQTNISKHRNDIFYMLTDLGDFQQSSIILPAALKKDVIQFSSMFPSHSAEWMSIRSHIKSKHGKAVAEYITPELLLEQLFSLFPMD